MYDTTNAQCAQLAVLYCLIFVAFALPYDPSFGSPAGESAGKTLVVGSGGVGETALMDYLKQHGVKTNGARNEDGMKHSPYAFEGYFGWKPGSCPPESSLYIFGDPAHAISSLYRRDYQRGQVIILSGNRVNGRGFCIQLPKTAEKYLSIGDDFAFQLLNHMRDWVVNCPRMMAITLDDFAGNRVADITRHLNISELRINGYALQNDHGGNVTTYPYYAKTFQTMKSMAKMKWVENGYPE